MRTMQPLPEATALAAAREVLMRLHGYGDDACGELHQMPQVERGLSILTSMLPGLADPVREAARATAKLPMRWGPAHGDFHTANLLWQEGAAKLIDFDCVRTRSLQAFDWIYFDVEHAARRDERPWLQVVTQRLRSGQPGALELGAHDIRLDRPGLWLLFALDRVGQEAKFGIRAKRDVLGDAMTTALAQWQADLTR